MVELAGASPYIRNSTQTIGHEKNVLDSISTNIIQQSEKTRNFTHLLLGQRWISDHIQYRKVLQSNQTDDPGFVPLINITDGNLSCASDTLSNVT